MSKYQKGDKFWFEIKDVIDASDGKTMYECSNGGYAADGMLDGYYRLDPDEKANADFDAGYAEGLRELWGALKTADDMLEDDRIKYLGHKHIADAFENGIGPEEFISGIRKYKEAQKAEAEIKVGDEVDPLGDKDSICRFFVTRITRDRVSGTSSDGRWAACDKREAHKTGRHFPQIAEVLERMKTDDHTDTN